MLALAKPAKFARTMRKKIVIAFACATLIFRAMLPAGSRVKPVGNRGVASPLKITSASAYPRAALELTFSVPASISTPPLKLFSPLSVSALAEFYEAHGIAARIRGDISRGEAACSVVGAAARSAIKIIHGVAFKGPEFVRCSVLWPWAFRASLSCSPDGLEGFMPAIADR